MGFTDFDHHMAFVNRTADPLRPGGRRAIRGRSCCMAGHRPGTCGARSSRPSRSGTRFSRRTCAGSDNRRSPWTATTSGRSPSISTNSCSSLGFEDVALVGHDMGGPTAYAYACAHPERSPSPRDPRRGDHDRRGRAGRVLQAPLPSLVQRGAGHRGPARDRRARARPSSTHFYRQLLQPRGLQPGRHRRVRRCVLGTGGDARRAWPTTVRSRPT